MLTRSLLINPQVIVKMNMIKTEFEDEDVDDGEETIIDSTMEAYFTWPITKN